MPCSIPRQYLVQFLSSVRNFYRQENNSKIEMLGEMADYLDQLIADEGKIYPGLENKSLLPAACHLSVAVKDTGDSTSQIADKINLLAPFLKWQQTAGYDALGEHYLNNYGYCSLIGPGLLIEHESLKLGFGIWGPNLHYPLHHHAAEECYHVLGSPIQFRRDKEHWKTYIDAQSIYNSPWEVHELKSTDKPMFLLYTWRGNVASDAMLI